MRNAKSLKKKYRRGRHSVSLLHAHLVFCVKFRRRVIMPRDFEILRRAMRRSAAALEINLIAIEADGDHLHVMLCYPPTISLSKIVQRLKGTSSRALRQRKLTRGHPQALGQGLLVAELLRRLLRRCATGNPQGLCRETDQSQQTRPPSA